MKKSNALIAYFTGSFEELRKVTWPTKEQTIRLTIIVSIFSLVVAFVFGVLDFIFTYGFNALLDLL